MSRVDDAFSKLKSNLEITKSEQQLAARRQNEIRDHLGSKLSLDRSFLTGSYARHTKTKKLKDVDIFCVLKAGTDDAALRDATPLATLRHLQEVLSEKYTSPVPTIGRRSCTIQFSSDDEVPSFDVVLAVDRNGGGYEIPDTTVGDWIATDPESTSRRRPRTTPLAGTNGSRS
jgi:predicted nucleotidyltransferase